jgi:hypothetical protein
LRVGLEPPAGLVTIPLRHHEVDQDEIGPAFSRQRESLGAGLGDLQDELAGQHCFQRQQVGRLIVDGQNQWP